MTRLFICFAMRLFFLLMTAIWIADCNAAGTQLSCKDALQSRDAESRLMQENQVSRPGQHVLELRHAKGQKRFIDQPPHEDLGGRHWFYCGYDAILKVHLIGKTEDALFSGVILRHSDGRIFAAGHTVLFSPDHKKFLAIRQQNGRDGEDWAIYQLYGRKLWAGYAGILSVPVKGDYERVVAEFLNPVWRDENVVEADMSCEDQIKRRVSMRLDQVRPHWLNASGC